MSNLDKMALKSNHTKQQIVTINQHEGPAFGKGRESSTTLPGDLSTSSSVNTSILKNRELLSGAEGVENHSVCWEVAKYDDETVFVE